MKTVVEILEEIKGKAPQAGAEGTDILGLLAPGEEIPWGEWFAQVVRGALYVERRRVASQVRIAHLERQIRDNAHRPHVQTVLRALISEETRLLARLEDLEKKLDRLIASEVAKHPAWPWLSRVKGIGRENVAKVLGQINITKCPYVSNLYRYAGYDVMADGRARRRVKGQGEGFNGMLRTMCYRLGVSLLRARGAYYQFYLRAKEEEVKKLTAQGIKIVPTRMLPKRNGKYYEPEGVMTEGHVHMRALRKTIKLFLSHLWQVWRQAEGLPAPAPYPIAQGHAHYLDPWEFAEKG